MTGDRTPRYIDGVCVTALPGDDLSDWLGPDAVCATQEQCDEVERLFVAVHADVMVCAALRAMAAGVGDDR